MSRYTTRGRDYIEHMTCMKGGVTMDCQVMSDWLLADLDELIDFEDEERPKTVCVWDFQRIYESLQYYEDREEDGLLINLPCKIGDTVYRGMYALTEHSPFKMRHGVSEERVTGVEIGAAGMYVKTDKYVYPLHLFTEYLFPDKQTAYDLIVERTKPLEDGENT